MANFAHHRAIRRSLALATCELSDDLEDPPAEVAGGEWVAPIEVTDDRRQVLLGFRCE